VISSLPEALRRSSGGHASCAPARQHWHARGNARIDHTVYDTVATCTRAARILRRGVLATILALPPIATALAAQDSRSPLPDASAPFGAMGWGLVVALGLLAVAAAAFTLGRPHRSVAPDRAANDSILGTTITEPASVDARVVPGSDHDSESAARAHDPESTPFAFTPPDAHSAAEVPRASVAAHRADATPAEDKRSSVAAGSHAFLALHHVDLSIDVLRRHLDGEERPMPAVWVMLLDLCRTHGREHKFRELALDFHRRFNVRAPSWDRYPPGRDEPGLEAYPRLVRAITAAWGTHDCRRLLDRLLHDNRGGARRGFTLNAYNDLIALRRAAHSVLETIDADLALEARQRVPAAPSAVAAPGEVSANDAIVSPSPLIRDLEDQLEGDLKPSMVAASALEREHPAFASVLMREWGNAALAGRLCEMLARGGDGGPPLSAEVAEELELLRRMAERRGTTTGVAIAASA
jgi:hypothetical protein